MEEKRIEDTDDLGDRAGRTRERGGEPRGSDVPDVGSLGGDGLVVSSAADSLAWA